MHKKKLIAVSVLLALFAETALAGLGSDKTKYVGGTVSALKEGQEGKSPAKDPKVFVFQAGTDKVEIPYDEVDSLEYGQKAGRRVGVGFGVNPLFIVSEKRRHCLTLVFTD